MVVAVVAQLLQAEAVELQAVLAEAGQGVLMVLVQQAHLD
jgi:hypothetical protein